MKLINKEKKVELIIEDKLLKDLSLIGFDKYPNEFGGFLVGYYSNNFKTLDITNFILPKKFKSFPYLFERSAEGVEENFRKLFNYDTKQYYIGEWHTHPNNSSLYSNTDLNAMIDNVNSQSIRISNPVLLIIGVNKEKIIDFTFYLYDNKTLLRYE